MDKWPRDLRIAPAKGVDGKTVCTPEGLAAALQALLQESDCDRELDSIEALTVRGFLINRGWVHGDDAPLPTTIKGWVSWVVRCSNGS